MANSLVEQYIASKGLTYKRTDSERIELESCLFCNKSGFGHLYIVADSSNRDGLYLCQKCGKSGNFTTLKKHFGDTTPSNPYNIESQADKGKKIEPLPNIEECHQALLEDEAALDYLMNGRGFSREIIEQQKIGLVNKRYFREAGEVKALVYPYLVNGNCVFVHFRTLPTMPLSENKVPKAFSSPSGWEVPLYNGGILLPGLKELHVFEGEADTIAALDKGIESSVGVPGANIRKATWIDTLDSLELERVYICYDSDRVGQKAAQELASRIGIEKCYKIRLPEFTIVSEDGEVKPGKDANGWFVSGGGSKEAFNKLKEEAKLFDISGVSSSLDSLDQLEESFEGKEGLSSKYLTPWNSLNKLVGFDDGDVIDICAAEKQGKSTLALNLVEFMTDTYKEDGIIICLEMPTVRVARKWVCLVTGVKDRIPKTTEDATNLLTVMKSAVKQARSKAQNREGSLYFCYPQIKEVDDMYKLIRDCIRRYGVKWVVVDNLQLLCDRTLKNPGYRTTHLSQISKTLAGITKDYSIKMIRILQPHRIREGQMVTTDNVDGSSQVAKDCDVMITAHRNRIGEMSSNDFASVGYIESESALDSKMLVTVGLSRYSSGGYVTLNFDGASSRVTEFGMAGLDSNNVLNTESKEEAKIQI